MNENGPVWPISGQRMILDIEVSHVGPHYDDIEYKILKCPPAFYGPLETARIEELIDDGLPIASGYYTIEVEFILDEWTDWESGGRECDYGYILIACKRLGNLI